jgi:proline iminopeptidase
MIKKWALFLAFLCVILIQYVEASAQGLGLSQCNEIFVESNGSTLFCRVLGKGKPLIVIHGGPGLTQDYLLPQLSSLADNNLVIFYDQRGCGRSTGEINKDTINIPNLVNDLESIRQAFRFDKISILGHSWGGFLAMHYAIAYPQFVEKLILSNSMPACSEGHSLFFEEYKNRTAPYQEELSAITATQEFQAGEPKSIEQFYRIIFRTYCYHSEKADLLNLQMTPSASVNGAKVFQVIREDVFKIPYNLHESLKTLRIPTLVIHGDFDPIPATTAQKIHESIQGSKYVLLKQCGHFPYVERKEEYFDFLKEFLSSSETATRNIERKANAIGALLSPNYWKSSAEMNSQQTQGDLCQ